MNNMFIILILFTLILMLTMINLYINKKVFTNYLYMYIYSDFYLILSINFFTINFFTINFFTMNFFIINLIHVIYKMFINMQQSS